MFQIAYIEIERHSNLKYEFNKEAGRLMLDRILPYPYFYPAAYGFIPGTRADDGDEMDVLLITDRVLTRGQTLGCFIVGALEMEDEKGNDLKLLAIPQDDFLLSSIRDIGDISSATLEDIRWFFSQYKSRDHPLRWSRVGNFIPRVDAFRHYTHSLIDSSSSP